MAAISLGLNVSVQIDSRVMTSHSTCGGIVCLFFFISFLLLIFSLCNLRKRSDCLEAAAVWQTMHDPNTPASSPRTFTRHPAGTDLDLKYLGVSGRLCIYFFINKILYSQGSGNFMVVSCGRPAGRKRPPTPHGCFPFPVICSSRNGILFKLECDKERPPKK